MAEGSEGFGEPRLDEPHTADDTCLGFLNESVDPPAWSNVHTGISFSFARFASSPPVHTATMRHSALRAASKAERVSSVSPEWEEHMTKVSAPRAKRGRS